MQGADPAFRVLDETATAQPLAVYDEIIGNFSSDPEDAPGRPLDRSRVVEFFTSIDYSTGADLNALLDAHESTGGGPVIARWTSALYFGEEDLDPPDGMIEVDFAELVRVAHLEDPDEHLFARLDKMIAAGLAASSAAEYCLYSADGRWISVSWDSNDFYALGGSDAFMDAYVNNRPEAPDDVVTWLSSLGSVFVTWAPVRGWRRPRGPRFLRKLMTRVEYEDRFEGSPTELFLSRLYGPSVAAELWEIHLEMESMSTSFVGDAWRDLAQLKQQRPELESRLLDIWNGSGKPKSAPT